MAYYKSREFCVFVRELVIESRSVNAYLKIIIFYEIILLTNNVLLLNNKIQENIVRKPSDFFT